jgi:hypothetical protein
MKISSFRSLSTIKCTFVEQVKLSHRPSPPRPAPPPAQAQLKMCGVDRNIWVGLYSFRTLSDVCYSARGVTFRTLGLFASRSESVRRQLVWIPGRRIPVYLPLYMHLGSALVIGIQNKTYKQNCWNIHK